MFVKCFGFGDRNSSVTVRGYPTVIEELCRPFSLSDIKKATDNFHLNRRIEIRAVYGSVYKGCLQNNDGSDFAVAVSPFYELEEFKNEVELLCQLRHPNIISLIGFCNHKKYNIIMHEYMSNGSLRRHLQRGELTWKKRLEICIGAARGLHYLHAGLKRTIIHLDINPSNILLDDNMHPKLAGLGFSIQGARFMSKPKPIQVQKITGTSGYMANEFVLDGLVTDKCDVFSFGVILLGVVIGKKYLLLGQHLEESIDLNIKGKIAPECWQVFIDIMSRCMEYEADERPTMGEVEVELQRALSLQEQADITNTDGHYTLLSTTIFQGKLD